MSQYNDEGGSFFGSAEKFRKELERLLDKAKGQGERALDAMGFRGGWQPPIDLVESVDEVVVTLDVPGMKPEELSLEIVGNMLTISGERIEVASVEGEVVHLRQRATGKFTRSIPMPSPVNHERVNAEVHNGVLTVRLAKSERAKAHKVPISERVDG